MAITRSQIARQLLAEGGVSLDDAKRMAPEGEFLAYINPKEAQMLKDAGGSGIMTPMGIPSFVDFGGSGTGYGSAADTFSAASGNPGADSRSNFGTSGMIGITGCAICVSLSPSGIVGAVRPPVNATSSTILVT